MPRRSVLYLMDCRRKQILAAKSLRIREDNIWLVGPGTLLSRSHIKIGFYCLLSVWLVTAGVLGYAQPIAESLPVPQSHHHTLPAHDPHDTHDVADHDSHGLPECVKVCFDALSDQTLVTTSSGSTLKVSKTQSPGDMDAAIDWGTHITPFRRLARGPPGIGQESLVISAFSLTGAHAIVLRNARLRL